MFEFGAIVFVAFPFTDLSSTKIRPALIISRDNDRRADIVLAFISSRPHLAEIPDSLELEPTPENGLKAPSIVRFDKLVTLEKRIVLGEAGQVDPVWLARAAHIFHGVFGFTDV